MAQTIESIPRPWPEVFSKSRPLSYRTYDRPLDRHLRKAFECVDAAEEANETGSADRGASEMPDEPGDVDGDEAGDQDEPDEPMNEEDDSIARVFMRGRLYKDAHEILDEHRGQAGPVEAFCKLRFQDLKDESQELEGEPNALLHERSAGGSARASLGPLQWRQLNAAMQTPRFRPAEDAAMSPRDGEDTRGSDEHPVPDADQRRLYIHKLTPHNAAVLMANASYHEAEAMRDLLHAHVTRSSEISVKFTSQRFETFAMRVCLPYRTLADGQRPWTPRPIPVPTWHSHAGRQLHEATITIQVDGCNNQVFTVIGLVDSPDPRDGVQPYHEDCLSDPLMKGKALLDRPIDDPREWFLTYWKVWLAQVAAEVEDSVTSFRTAFKRNCEETAQISALRQAGLPVPGDQLSTWIYTATRLACLCTLVHDELFVMINAWEQFNQGDVRYFKDADNLDLSAKMTSLLGGIASHYACLGKNKTALANLRRDLEFSSPNSILVAQGVDIQQRLQLLAQDQLQLSGTQQQSNDEVRRLTNTSMMFLPFVLTSGLFSVAPSALPFTPSPPAFGVSLVVAFAMNILLVYYFEFFSAALTCVKGSTGIPRSRAGIQ